MISRLAWPSHIQIPGDKSLSHRLLMMAVLSEGTSELTGLSEGQDVRSTVQILRDLGFKIETSGEKTRVAGMGFHRWTLSNQVLDCGNSGTTARHVLGLIAGGVGQVTLTGDASLRSRPMNRIVDPLKQMGASVSLFGNGHLPAEVLGAELQSLSYALTVPSAQVKSSLMLAACNSGVPLSLSGRLEGRDHTENLIPFFGGVLSREHGIQLPVQGPWHGVNYSVPKDPSALANWITAALLTERTESFNNILLNSTRIGFIRALQSMGANIEIEVQSTVPESVGRVTVRPSLLKGCKIEVPSSHFIDEAPLLALLASQATGETVIEDLSELRVKECDRFTVTMDILRRLGVQMEAKDQTWIIQGQQRLRSAKIETHNDHRMAMLGLIAGMVADVEVDDTQSLLVSDPFMSELIC